ncbi:hypothetical protein [Halopseudomonas aestusnigri]|jgi:hypothetical protein|uniref:Uncharacterized protein n=1 Tax=Halopseudomonas aestusnigri TaxID=857252 RepID=A0AAQ1G8B5_9GAMM|nr:hypothetical protein [Halopseudomonas aestusnigri]OWL88841.1 hypothetical protein B7O88_09265 [Halopseudomonas aestusnigri]SEG35435.1 hypothetical protein SAMN05216586_105176 [Halopseudomonas aestusnigri]
MQYQEHIKKLPKLAWDHGERTVSAALGLDAIANLLGADGSEHYMNNEDREGLAHAIRALSGFLHSAGNDLCEEAEMCGALEKSQ